MGREIESRQGIEGGSFKKLRKTPIICNYLATFFKQSLHLSQVGGGQRRVPSDGRDVQAVPQEEEARHRHVLRAVVRKRPGANPTTSEFTPTMPAL
jgi:hypothetical protein